MAEVRLEAVEKRFGATTVVRGLDLTVRSGELVALLGPSGCGKTTTLRMISGLERVSAGQISISERVVDDGARRFDPPERRGLGMVFQSYAIWPHRSVEANVAYPLERQRVGATERGERVSRALDAVRLGAFSQRRPDQLSGGQLQRVALARALVADPKVMLLDEPLSNLDAALREELRAELAALRERIDITMIYVTHDQAEALALADRIAVMNQGVIEQLASPRELWSAPATPFVGAFVGGANVLKGHLDSGVFRIGEQEFVLPEGTAGAEQGAAEVLFRPEDVELGDEVGCELTPSAVLFQGAFLEYRFEVGSRSIRAFGPDRADPKRPIRLSIRRAQVFKV
ncbi:MAG: ABC transporter ATP-binding protein [Myxococcota bacterium]